ncbi:hypothetical protein C7S20_06880 [Christiangramia fulva]|uniref:SnoaL-like domain-containing protein n=1 Tax=Christiangramia fulva TaxID=2126553 RepID=A0A2R3Z418_9FLAO|nr:nuclear transport factor 2 family protein [Christiangramia fulva]AVR45017.1 hypothetical protein C7S20_06880 [Christiangramia fulva]
MKRSLLLAFFLIGIFSLNTINAQVKMTEENIRAAKKQINSSLDNWHKAAANADFKGYFALMTDDAVFIGTDPTELWNLEEFKTFSKPYFDSGQAWNLTPVERHIYLANHRRIAWFDELLDTHMGICRGSGIMEKIDGQWKVQHYVLSLTIPNDNVQQVTLIKKDFDKNLLAKLHNN